MSIAWTTIAVVALLLPGISFFIGMSTYDRLSREIIRTSAVSDLAMAILVATVIHLVACFVLWLFGVDFKQLAGLFAHDRVPQWLLAERMVSLAVPAAIYVLLTSGIGGGLGVCVAKKIVSGPLRFLATHKWIYSVIGSTNAGVVTAFVMTNVKENHRVLMYKGRLQEFYLGTDGKLAYIVLKNCSRFFMTFENTEPRIGKQLALFGEHQSRRSHVLWDYLFIEGSQISNVLFDPSPELVETDEGLQAVAEAIKRMRVARDVIASTRAAANK